MTRATRFRPALFTVLPLLLAVALSGCTLLGLGAAAGAAVGGCSILDENDDDAVSEAEFTAGVFDNWDDNDDLMLSEAEFEDGIDNSDAFADWSGDFDAWDDDGDDMISQTEFEAGVDEQGGAGEWVDTRCDALGL